MLGSTLRCAASLIYWSKFIYVNCRAVKFEAYAGERFHVPPFQTFNFPQSKQNLFRNVLLALGDGNERQQKPALAYIWHHKICP